MKNLSTMRELTIELNRLRVLNGKSPLKAWKESKEKAVDAIKAEVEILKPIVKTSKKKLIFSTGNDKIEEVSGPTSEVPEVPEVPEETPAPVEKAPESKKTFTVVELAFELKISPKVARAKLRRNVDDLPPKTGKGWTFANDVKEALIKILS